MQFVTLSKRNLLTLLHKLVMPGSERTLLKPGPNGSTLVSVVTDEEAYRNREPGRMHPETEMFIREATSALKIAEKDMQIGSNPPPWCYDAAKAICLGGTPNNAINAVAAEIGKAYRRYYDL
jgi:hypothetical protein